MFSYSLQHLGMYHGVFFQYTDGDLKLGLPGEGRTILETARDEEGIDAEVTFEIEERVDKWSDWIRIFEGQAIMQNLTIDQDYANVDFRESNLLTEIHDNLNTKVSLASTKSVALPVVAIVI